MVTCTQDSFNRVTVGTNILVYGSTGIHCQEPVVLSQIVQQMVK